MLTVFYEMSFSQMNFRWENSALIYLRSLNGAQSQVSCLVVPGCASLMS